MKTDEQSYNIDAIFEQLNFLQLKKTTQNMLDLPHQVLERFTGKYTSVIIYLLNILDSKTAVTLLDRLTDTSIMYLMEEEVRLMLLSLFSLVTDEPEYMVNLSHLVEEIDRGSEEAFLVKKEYDMVLQAMITLVACRERASGLKFLYLRELDPQRLGNILVIILARRPILIPILMLYAPDELRQFILIEVTKRQPDILKVVPAGVYDLRFYTFLTSRDFTTYLPEEVKDKLEYLDIVQRLETGLEKRIVEIRERLTNNPIEARHEIMNETYEILASEDFEIQNLMLLDLVNRGFLSPVDGQLLRTIYEKKLEF